MMYISTSELWQLKEDVSKFMHGALTTPGPADLSKPTR